MQSLNDFYFGFVKRIHVTDGHPPMQTKRASEAYRLPAGAMEIMGKDIKTNYKCEKDNDG